LSGEDKEHLKHNLLTVDKHTFKDYLEQRGIDISSQPLEVETGETSGGGNLHVNEYCESVNMRGLFGLPFSGMLSTALCGGYAAGTGAGKSIEGIKEPEDIDPILVLEETVKLKAPLERDEGYSPEEFEDMIRQIMEHYMGHKRSLTGLNIALEKFEILEKAKEKIKAVDYHEMTRAQEAIHLLKYCRLMIRSVIERKGMRGFYNLVDYPPKLDPELRDKYVVLSQVGGEQTVTFELQTQADKEVQDAS
jgi:succinate dehydrogenase/fumarate reductase flavoprotein subunit